MNSHAALLAGMYHPPLKRFPDPQKRPHEWARARAWGSAVEGWLAAYKNEKTRRGMVHALAGLLSFCRKLPWQVSPKDGAAWLAVGLARKAPRTQANHFRLVSQFYRFACAQSWTSPAGRRLRLCRSDPFHALACSKSSTFFRAAALGEAELARLLAAFDRQTRAGRRDYALFMVMLATGLHLRQVLDLRLVDLRPSEMPGGSREDARTRGWAAAWELVRSYLEAEGRLVQIQPQELVFTSLYKTRRDKPLGSPLAETGIRRAFQRYVGAAGLDGARVQPETLRFTGALRLLEAGASLEELRLFLGLKDRLSARRMANHLRKNGFPARTIAGQPGKQRARRATGGQPGNRNALKHGQRSARFRLSRLGLPWGSVRDLDLAEAGQVIAALRGMELELAELEVDTLAAEIQRVRKLSHIAVTIGRVMRLAYQARQAARRLDEEEWLASLKNFHPLEPLDSDQ